MHGFTDCGENFINSILQDGIAKAQSVTFEIYRGTYSLDNLRFNSIYIYINSHPIYINKYDVLV